MIRFQKDTESPSAGSGSAPHLPAPALIRQAFRKANVLCLRIVGPPGSGKTELIERTLKLLTAPQRVAVIVINPAPARDVDRLRNLCGHITAIEDAVPKPQSIWRIVAKLNLELFDIVLIETAGGLAPLQDLGQDATVAVFAVSGGDDKAAEYHNLLTFVSAVLVTKIDLQSQVKFDPKVFRNDVRLINADAEVHELSAASGAGMENWIGWIERLSFTKHPCKDGSDSTSDSFLG